MTMAITLNLYFVGFDDSFSSSKRLLRAGNHEEAARLFYDFIEARLRAKGSLKANEKMSPRIIIAKMIGDRGDKGVLLAKDEYSYHVTQDSIQQLTKRIAVSE